jgi:creatinine amidohydrolase/Fe(II)-dependent formamide hydrolase-like protein
MSAKREGPVLVDEITSADFARLTKTKPLVIVPMGSVEEHGSHLPLWSARR